VKDFLARRADPHETSFMFALPFRQSRSTSLRFVIRAVRPDRRPAPQESIMKRAYHALACTILLASGVAAHAAPALTPQQCADYPFVHTKGPVTHAQIVNELAELESVGYDPSAGESDNYPNDIDSAQQRLMAKYQHDCAGARPGAIASAAP
jgi:hypothetical protein